MTTATADDPRNAKARCEAAKDAAVIVRLLIQGRLADVSAYLATMRDRAELDNLIIAFGGMCAALTQELEETQPRHGEAVTPASFMAALATWQGRLSEHRD